jgi:hypothetical protein
MNDIYFSGILTFKQRFSLLAFLFVAFVTFISIFYG